MTQRTRKPHESLADLLRRARGVVGDDPDAPISEEEEAVMAEIRAEHGRPSRREISSFAKRLARRSR